MVTADARRALKVCVLAPAPELPLLECARALACGQRFLSRSAPELRILEPVVKLVGREISLEGRPVDADVLLHPHDALLHPRSVQASLDAARRARRPIALFSNSDDTRRSPGEWRTLWRTSGFASRLGSHERVATGEVPDLVEEQGTDRAKRRPWAPRPTIGFVGHVARLLRSAQYLRQGWQHWYGFTLRDRVLRAFEESRAVDTKFIRRSRNLGPPGTGIDADEERRRMRREYVDSVFETDYSLCVRGAGNWSYRFFETLAAGRIPVLIDTDSVLPGEGSIPWERHLCRIPLASVPRAAELVADFHASLGPERFLQMQSDNRALWVERLAPAPFFLAALRQTIADSGSVPST
jgi:hypothetical protein